MLRDDYIKCFSPGPSIIMLPIPEMLLCLKQKLKQTGTTDTSSHCATQEFRARGCVARHSKQAVGWSSSFLRASIWNIREDFPPSQTESPMPSCFVQMFFSVPEQLTFWKHALNNDASLTEYFKPELTFNTLRCFFIKWSVQPRDPEKRLTHLNSSLRFLLPPLSAFCPLQVPVPLEL